MTESPVFRTTISAASLVDAVQRAQKATTSEFPCLELRSLGQRLSVRASCTRYGIEIDVAPSSCQGTLSCKVLPDLLLRALKAVAGEITVTQDSTNRDFLQLTDGRFNVHVPFAFNQHCPWPDEDAPQSPIDDLGWIRTLKDVATHAAKDQSRINIYGICIEHDGDVGSIVATNGHRMAIATQSFEFPKMTGVVVYPEIANFLDPACSVSLGVGKEYVRFEQDYAEIWSRIGQLSYPPFRSVVPSGWRVEDRPRITATRRDLLTVIESFTNLQVKPVELRVLKGKLNFSTCDPMSDHPSATASVKSTSVSLPHPIRFDPSYFLDALKILHANVVEIFSEGRADPIVLNDPEGNVLSIVMPVRF